MREDEGRDDERSGVIPAPTAGGGVLFAALLSAWALLVALVTPVAAAQLEAPTNLTFVDSTQSLSFDGDGAAVGHTFTVSGRGGTPDPVPATIPVAAGGDSVPLGGLAPGNYAISGFALAGPGDDPSEVSESENFTILGVPDTPSNLAVDIDGDSAELTWDAPAGGSQQPARYEAEVTGPTPKSLEENAPATSIDLGTLAAGDYTVTLRAVTDQTSSATAQTTFSIGAGAAPAQPVIQAVADGSTVTVTWQDPAAGTPAVTGYTVSLPGSGQVPKSAGPDTRSVVFTSVAPGTYTARVVASNGVGDSDAAEDTVDVVATPSAPRNVTATLDGENVVTVEWDPPTDDGGGIVDYQVEVTPGSTPVQVVGADDERRVTFSGLSSGDYTVSVRARNAAGNSQAGTAGFQIVVAPDAPQNVVGTSGIRSTTVTWDAPADNGNGTISGYEVTVAGTTKTVDAGTFSVVFTDVPIGTHTARVVARNDSGLGSAGLSPEFDSIRVFHPFDSEAAYAQQVYRDLFGRAPTSAEQAALTSLTTPDRSNAASTLTGLMRSDQFEPARQVSRLYFAYFGRVPDRAGQDYWTDLLMTGRLQLQDVSDEFARSQEFINTYGQLDNRNFVAVVYARVLFRQPDIAGYEYWLDQMTPPNNLTRGGVMTWFTEGNEFIALSLPAVDTSLAFIMLLDREPSVPENSVWVNGITKDPAIDLGDLVSEIYQSDEYAERVSP